MSSTKNPKTTSKKSGKSSGPSIPEPKTKVAEPKPKVTEIKSKMMETSTKKKFDKKIPEVIHSDSEESFSSEDSISGFRGETSQEDAAMVQANQYNRIKYENYQRRREELHREFESKIQTMHQEFHAQLKALSWEMHEEMRSQANKLLEAHKPEKDFTEFPTKSKRDSEKQFKYQESILSIMFEKDQSIKTLYHIAIASLSVFFINLILRDYKETGLLIDLDTLMSIFNRPDAVFNIWIRVFCFHLLIIHFTRWVHFSKPSTYIWGPIYGLFHLSMLTYSAYNCFYYELEFASSMIVVCECLRMNMKMHSYFRNKLLYAGDCWKEYTLPSKGSKPAGHVPQIKFHSVTREFNKYIFFHLVPTLIYRDNYVKGPPTNYKKAIYHFLNFVTCIYFTYILFKTFCLPIFSKTGLDPGNWKDFISSAFTGIVPGVMCLFLLFFGLLHSWLNGFAEIMRFPDRYFYEDWWNARELGSFYRRWNVIVYDWLYYYVYLDIVRFSKGRITKSRAMLASFVLSAVAHEFIVAVAVKFFYPILMVIILIPGLILIGRKQQPKKIGSSNIIFWIVMFVGLALITVTYSREFYARRDSKVNPELWGAWYHVSPRFLLALLEKYQYI